MAAERDLELLDDYLANRLNANERTAFEQKLVSDPDLQTEFNVQQALIGGIQKARIAELKAMMNNIPVSTLQTSGSTIATKVALWVAVVGAVGAGSYFVFKKDDAQPIEKTPMEQPKQDSQATEEVKPQGGSAVNDDPTKPHEDSPVVSEEEASSEQKPVGAPSPIKKKNSARQPAEPKIEVYDPTEEQEEEASPLPFESNKSPQLKETSDLAVEIDADNKKYKFHYQFKAGKLFLFGPFQKDLYEILEFFSDDTKTVFLYYNGDYYFLKDNNEKVRELTAVQNAELIRKLNEYRK